MLDKRDLELADYIIEGLAEQLGVRSGPTRDSASTEGDVLLTTDELAAKLRLHPEYVRRHALELGGRRVAGTGPWRFDLRTALSPMVEDAQPSSPTPKPRRRRRRGDGNEHLVPVPEHRTA